MSHSRSSSYSASVFTLDAEFVRARCKLSGIVTPTLVALVLEAGVRLALESLRSGSKLRLGQLVNISFLLREAEHLRTGRDSVLSAVAVVASVRVLERRSRLAVHLGNRLSDGHLSLRLRREAEFLRTRGDSVFRAEAIVTTVSTLE